MLCYRDMTFCKGPCNTIECFRHKNNLQTPEALKFFEEVPYMCVAYSDFTKDCKEKT